MKKRNVLALALALVMSVGMSSSVFAATWSGSAPKENDVERVTYQFMKETKEGKYMLADTAQMKSWVNGQEKMIIVDTMPAVASYNKQHVPGAINSEAPLQEKDYTSAEKADLMKQVKPLLSKKTVKKTTWTKVSKKTYKKLKKSNRKTKKSKKKVYYYKKVVKKYVVADKNTKIVVYCGHIGCARSHVAAAYLVKQGYTNVYRYGGGISAWVDAGNAVDKVETPAA